MHSTQVYDVVCCLWKRPTHLKRAETISQLLDESFKSLSHLSHGMHGLQTPVSNKI